MQVFDPTRAMNAFTAGAQIGEGIRQRQTQAGLAPLVARGDYQAASQFAGERGDLQSAELYRQQYADQIAQMDERTRAEAAQRADTLARIGNGLLKFPYEQRKAELMKSLPMLQAAGIDPAMIEQFDPTNFAINEVIGQALPLADLLKAQQPSGPYTLAPGARRYDAMGNLIAENPREIPEQRLTPYQEQSLAIQRDRMAMEQRRAEEAAARTSTRPLIGSESMGRVAAGLPNMRKAVSDLYSLFGTGYTPGQDWGALALEMLPGIGDVAARLAGGQDYQTFDLAYSQFEAAALPIMSGAAVTESEAKRALRALRVRIGDSQETINAKMANMSRMVQGLEAAAAGDTEALRQIVGGIASQEGQGAAPMQGEMEDNGLPPGFVIIE